MLPENAMRSSRRHKLWLALLVGAALAGCGPTASYAMAADMLPPVPRGDARVFIYRWLEPYESTAFIPAYLNEEAAGYTQNGAVLYRDVPAGPYTISVVSRGRIPSRSATVTLVAGQKVYARIETLSDFDPIFPDDTFSVVITDPSDGSREIQALWLIPG
jgi:hypothetical protein